MSYSKTFEPLKTYNNRYFSPDYLKSNPLMISIESTNGAFTTLTNKNLVRGSIRLKQSLNSEQYYIWGGFNASMLTFECSVTSIIDNAPDGEIKLVLTPTSNGSPLQSEAVTLFTGYVESAERNREVPGNWKITAYDRLYRMRNVTLAPFINNYIASIKAMNSHITWSMAVSFIERQLGLSGPTHPEWFSSIYFPDNVEISKLNGISILKEFALMNKSFGMIDGNGRLQYIQAEDAIKTQNYYCVNSYADKDLKYTEGHIWQPKLFISEPRTNLFYTTAETTPDDDYYNNVYTISNSPILGNNEWIETLYECDEYGAPASKYNANNMPAGLFDTKRLCLSNDENYIQQEYSIRVYGYDPTIPMGSQILINKFTNEWKNILMSYVMNRTITILSPELIQAELSANNSPYNSIVPEYEAGILKANALANKVDKHLPFVVNGNRIKKLKSIKKISKTAYDALEEKRDDTIYYVYEEEGN